MFRELTMMEAKEVLRRFGAGQTRLPIGRETGLGRNMVGCHLDAAADLGFRESEPSDELVAAVTLAYGLATCSRSQRCRCCSRATASARREPRSAAVCAKEDVAFVFMRRALSRDRV
ncbi:MAG: hypothetical protein RL385_6005 [Pseudomonadota bacterium]